MMGRTEACCHQPLAKFALDEVRSLDTADNVMIADLVFTCPLTKPKVQHWLDDDEDATDNEYE